MKNTRFQNLYELAQQVGLEQQKEEYERLKEFDDSFSNFEEYKKYQEEYEEYLKNKRTPERQQLIDDSYIYKDTIIKNDFKINMCLFHFKHIDPLEFDKNYKPLPLNEKEVYQYACTLIYEENNGIYEINSIFGGIAEDEHLARDRYNALKNKIEKSSIEEIFNEIEDELKKYEK